MKLDYQTTLENFSIIRKNERLIKLLREMMVALLIHEKTRN